MEFNSSKEDSSTEKQKKTRKFVERHLFIQNQRYHIIPNGGTGDCMFKAVCQAIEGTEVNHIKIRAAVVNFVINRRWDKFKESIEIQHVQGSQYLSQAWKENAIETYKNYMNSPGTLASSSELHAAGELFNFNFVTIQEYTDNDKTTYRVENSSFFKDKTVPIYSFLFTGDFDNGHWEFLKPQYENEQSENLNPIPDGLYIGSLKIFIDDNETTVEEWLKMQTNNNANDFRRLKNSIKTRFPSVNSSHPFEWNDFHFESNDTVVLNGSNFNIISCSGTDLFSVLSLLTLNEVERKNAASINKLEDQIVNYRMENFELLNEKLITQPYSHGFDKETLKYMAMAFKGNIHDLLSAADIYGFSFQIYFKNNNDSDVRYCRFVHADRWGGEADKMLHFFMRIVPKSSSKDQVIAKWWYLEPHPHHEVSRKYDENNNAAQIGDFSTITKLEELSDCDSIIIESPLQLEALLSSSTKESQKSSGVEKNQPSTTPLRKSKKLRLESRKKMRRRKLLELEQKLKENDSTSSNSKERTDSDVETTGVMRRQGLNKRSKKVRMSQPQEINEGTMPMPDADWKMRQLGVNALHALNINDGPKSSKKERFKTVVEVYESATSKMRHYVFDGFKSKDDVLQSLYDRGYIKNAPSNSTNVKVGTDNITRNSIEKGRTLTMEEYATKTKAIAKMETGPFAAKVRDVNENDQKDCFNEEVEVIKEEVFNFDKSIADFYRKAGVSELDSIERHNKFLTMHQKVSPYVTRDATQPNWLRKGWSWILNLFRRCKGVKIEPAPDKSPNKMFVVN